MAKNCCANCVNVKPIEPNVVSCPKPEYLCFPGVTMCDGTRGCNPCPEFKGADKPKPVIDTADSQAAMGEGR